jgi:plastocyanin
MVPLSPTRRTLLRYGGAALAIGSTAGCLGDGTADGTSGTTVEMTDELVFEPETVRISTSDTIQWRNTGSVEHTVTAREKELPKGAAYFASGGFESERVAQSNLDGGLLAPDERYEHTFETPGTYAYYCIPHEGTGMTGTVHVE